MTKNVIICWTNQIYPRQCLRLNLRPGYSYEILGVSKASILNYVVENITRVAIRDHGEKPNLGFSKNN